MEAGTEAVPVCRPILLRKEGQTSALLFLWPRRRCPELFRPVSQDLPNWSQPISTHAFPHSRPPSQAHSPGLMGWSEAQASFRAFSPRLHPSLSHVSLAKVFGLPDSGFTTQINSVCHKFNEVMYVKPLTYCLTTTPKTNKQNSVNSC